MRLPNWRGCRRAGRKNLHGTKPRTPLVSAAPSLALTKQSQAVGGHKWTGTGSSRSSRQKGPVRRSLDIAGAVGTRDSCNPFGVRSGILARPKAARCVGPPAAATTCNTVTAPSSSCYNCWSSWLLVDEWNRRQQLRASGTEAGASNILLAAAKWQWCRWSDSWDLYQ